nr:hypothetical protein [Tanacetum cinerariifolium]
MVVEVMGEMWEGWRRSRDVGRGAAGLGGKNG